MHNYFNHIIENLTIDDLKVLGILSDEDATARFKALKRNYLSEVSNLTQAELRRIIYRLEALDFISVERIGKEHKFYLTNCGQMALNISLNGVVEK